MNRIALSTPQPARHESPTVKAQSLAYLIFERTDLDKAREFLTDFGLQVVKQTESELYLRGMDSAPFCYRVIRGEQNRFGGLAFSVAVRDDLVALSKLPGATAPAPVDYPGGGEMISLTDPSGFHVEVIFGQKQVAPLTSRPALQLNYDERPRINEPQRPAIAPAEILRLGHVVLEVADFQSTCGWYTRHLGLIPSDVQVLDDGSPVVTFLRLNLGDQPADHHTLAIAQGFMPVYSHSAYEVVDADAVGMGQRVLREKGWKHAWGIGRHILGSQIFDYWQDPWGDKHEHYCDGDLFTADKPTGIHPVSREAMSQWGQIMPASFTKPKITGKAVKAIVHNLRHSPDLTLKKLITLAKIFG